MRRAKAVWLVVAVLWLAVAASLVAAVPLQRRQHRDGRSSTTARRVDAQQQHKLQKQQQQRTAAFRQRLSQLRTVVSLLQEHEQAHEARDGSAGAVAAAVDAAAGGSTRRAEVQQSTSDAVAQREGLDGAAKAWTKLVGAMRAAGIDAQKMDGGAPREFPSADGKVTYAWEPIANVAALKLLKKLHSTLLIPQRVVRAQLETTGGGKKLSSTQKSWFLFPPVGFQEDRVPRVHDATLQYIRAIGMANDQAGHIAPDSVHGPYLWFNLIPLSPNANTGMSGGMRGWKPLENAAQNLLAVANCPVTVTIAFEYHDKLHPMRPTGGTYTLATTGSADPRCPAFGPATQRWLNVPAVNTLPELSAWTTSVLPDVGKAEGNDDAIAMKQMIPPAVSKLTQATAQAVTPPPPDPTVTATAGAVADAKSGGAADAKGADGKGDAAPPAYQRLLSQWQRPYGLGALRHMQARERIKSAGAQVDAKVDGVDQFALPSYYSAPGGAIGRHDRTAQASPYVEVGKTDGRVLKVTYPLLSGFKALYSDDASHADSQQLLFLYADAPDPARSLARAGDHAGHLVPRRGTERYGSNLLGNFVPLGPNCNTGTEKPAESDSARDSRARGRGAEGERDKSWKRAEEQINAIIVAQAHTPLTGPPPTATIDLCYCDAAYPYRPTHGTYTFPGPTEPYEWVNAPVFERINELNAWVTDVSLCAEKKVSVRIDRPDWTITVTPTTAPCAAAGSSSFALKRPPTDTIHDLRAAIEVHCGIDPAKSKWTLSRGGASASAGDKALDDDAAMLFEVLADRASVTAALK